MPALLILTTTDAKLFADWSTQLPQPAVAPTTQDALRRELAQAGARVWVKDIADPRSLVSAHPDVVVVVIGQPQSLPFEQAKLAGAGRFFLSYDESRTQLREIAATASELAEKNAIIQTLQARGTRASATLVRDSTPLTTALDDLSFMEAAIEHLEDRGRVLEEFRRAAQALLQASRVALFLQHETTFRSDRFGWTCPAASPLAQYMEEFPCAIDLDDWVGNADAATESHIRQQMQSWSARLIVPLFESGRLAGWAAYGPRADGRAYNAADRSRALELGRLLERCLEKASRLQALAATAQQEKLRARYLSGARLLGADAPSDPMLPPEIRALAGEVLRTGRPARLDPSPTIRFRAEAGPVPETGGVWAQWEDATPELAHRAAVAERERLKLCREMGLTLSHELGSPVVTLTTFLQLAQHQGASPELLADFTAQLDRDVGKLKELTRVLHLMQEFMSGGTGRIDLGELARTLQLHGIFQVKPNEVPPVIVGNEPMLRFALQAILDAIFRNRSVEDGPISIEVKRRGEGESETGLVVLSGRNLYLEGFVETSKGPMPAHPVLGVFLAREIIRWHNGVLQGGQGLTGSEVQISLRAGASGTSHPFPVLTPNRRIVGESADRTSLTL